MTANMTRDQRERLRQAFIAYVEKLANVKAYEDEDRREWAHVESLETIAMARGLGIKLGEGEE